MDKFKIPIKECGEELVEVEPAGFVAGRNYYHDGLTRNKKMYLRSGVVERLKKARQDLPKGYNFKVWDGYRPRQVQQKLWDKYYHQFKTEFSDWPEEKVVERTDKYVARAEFSDRVPNHTTGGAVDLTIVDDKGEEIEMGTRFDEFKNETDSDYFENINLDNKTQIKIRDNRRLLKRVLEKQGFAQYKDEWWHFDYGNQAWAFDKNKEFAIYGAARI